MTFEVDIFIPVLQMKKPGFRELKFLPKVTELGSGTHNTDPGLSNLKDRTVLVASQLVESDGARQDGACVFHLEPRPSAALVVTGRCLILCKSSEMPHFKL